jgi:hypothetical protein
LSVLGEAALPADAMEPHGDSLMVPTDNEILDSQPCAWIVLRYSPKIAR